MFQHQRRLAGLGPHSPTYQVGVQAVQAVSRVGVVTRLAVLRPDELHDLVLALTRSLRSAKQIHCQKDRRGSNVGPAAQNRAVVVSHVMSL